MIQADSDATLDSEVVDSPAEHHRRLRRAETVLRDRIGRVVIVLERTSSSHNFAAVLRTAEALGFQHIYLISVMETVSNLENDKIKSHQQKKKKKSKTDAEWSKDAAELAAHLGIAQGASKWITVHHFETAVEAIEDLKSNGYAIWATDLSQKAETLGFDKRAGRGGSKTTACLPPKLAFVMGTETSGISQLFVDAADRRVFLPMYGFADSFNLSVSCAMMMQQLLFLDPSILGSLEEGEKSRLRASWYAQLARTPDESVEFEAMLSNPPSPFRDTRRSDEHRAPHCRPTDLAKMVNASEYQIGR
jgi:tRNA G18 (ribose-2'-O)-methylase SpoU